MTTACLAGLAALLLLQGCKRNAPPPAMRGIHLAEPLTLPDLTLTDTEGRPFHLIEETRGRLALIFFGYTYCPDVCPMHMANIAAVLDDMQFTDRAKYRVIFVSVDPERDTPQRLRTWLDKFNPYFVGVTAPAPVIREFETALNLANAVTIPVENGEYSVGHASQVVAVEADGKARYVYPFGTRQRDWAHDLPHLLPGGKTPSPKADAPSAEPKDEVAAPGLRVETMLIPSPPAGGPAALFAVISNAGDGDDLLGISTSGAKRAELHETVPVDKNLRKESGHAHGGAMRMRQVAKISIPHGATLRLEPGKRHGMLIGLLREFSDGDTVPVELNFRRAGRISAIARVVPYAEIEQALAVKPEADE